MFIVSMFLAIEDATISKKSFDKLETWGKKKGKESARDKLRKIVEKR